jgi:Fe-S oxidoreductase
MDYPPGKIIAMHRAGRYDPVLQDDSIWMCVSCYACTQFCPAKVPLTPGLMTRAKENMILAGTVPAELEEAFRASQRYGNPLGKSARKRADWTRDLDINIPIMRKHDAPVDVLWFVGDYPAYHARVNRTAVALARILDALGISFGILGAEEQSDGDSQRLAGERGLFELLAEKNGRALEKYDFGRIITTDPHAYNALRNEYPALGIEYPVQHHTQFLHEYLDQLRPRLSSLGEVRVTFHDPCYLGRANGIYDEPRALIAAIPDVTIVEMAHHHEYGLCCGGGGGGLWLDGFTWEKAGVRLSDWRVQEALSAGADILAVACPYETPRFEDAVKTNRNAAGLRVMDITEMLAEAMRL